MPAGIIARARFAVAGQPGRASFPFAQSREVGGVRAPAMATRLVRAAFAFLLEHEPAGSILRSFDLEVIGRYFPGWEDDVRRRLSGT